MKRKHKIIIIILALSFLAFLSIIALLSSGTTPDMAPVVDPSDLPQPQIVTTDNHQDQISFNFHFRSHPIIPVNISIYTTSPKMDQLDFASLASTLNFDSAPSISQYTSTTTWTNPVARLSITPESQYINFLLTDHSNAKAALSLPQATNLAYDFLNNTGLFPSSWDFVNQDVKYTKPEGPTAVPLPTASGAKYTTLLINNTLNNIPTILSPTQPADNIITVNGEGKVVIANFTIPPNTEYLSEVPLITLDEAILRLSQSRGQLISAEPQHFIDGTVIVNFNQVRIDSYQLVYLHDAANQYFLPYYLFSGTTRHVVSKNIQYHVRYLLSAISI